jgi:toxin HigB-1
MLLPRFARRNISGAAPVIPLRCQPLPYIAGVIVSFRSKALARFWRNNDARGLPWELLKRLQLRLEVLHRAVVITDLRLPGFDLHPLHKDQAGRWAIKVNGPWRVTFAFDESRGEASDVDFEQYH